MTSEISPYVDVTALTTDAAGVVSAMQPVPARIETRMTYDALGNVRTRTEGYGRPGEERQTQYDYDALGRQTTTTLPNFKVYDRANDNLATNGMNGTVQIVETQPIAPQTIVTFDALGNAVMNRDADGKYTYKVYDALRRLKYEIDARHYVTEYGYDAFGNNTSVKRYSNPLNFGAVAGLQAHGEGTKFTLAEMSPRLIPDQSSDRVITTQYDVLNRAFLVTQPAVFSFDRRHRLEPQNIPNVGARRAAPTTPSARSSSSPC
jgi:YD repeat-containing protein